MWLTIKACIQMGGANVSVPKVLADIFESVAAAIYLDTRLSANKKESPLESVWKVYSVFIQHEISKYFRCLTIVYKLSGLGCQYANEKFIC